MLNNPPPASQIWDKLGYTAEDLVITGSNKPFLLNDPKTVWMIFSGKVDIFAVRVENGEPVGTRRHLFRVEVGDAILGMDLKRYRREIGLLAVGLSGTRLLPVKRARLEALARSAEDAEWVVPLINNWVAGLSRGLSKNLTLPRQFETLESGQETRLEASGIARPRKGILWVSSQRGIAWFMGRNDLLLMDENDFLPVSEYTWLQSAGRNTLLALDTPTFFQRENAWDSVETFHRTALNLIIRSVERERRVEVERLRTRAQFDRVHLSNAFAYLASVLRPESALSFFADDGVEDPLLTACRLVGASLGIPVRPHPNPIDGEPEPQTLDGITSASRIRTRQVALRGDWWEKDNGPLLAFLQKEGVPPADPAADNHRAEEHPVALLPVSTNQYVLHNPLNHTQVIVTESVAATLSPFAYSFYRPFPDAPLRPWDVWRFGMQGSRADLRLVLLMGLAGGMLGIIPPLILGYIFDSAIPNGDTAILLALTAILVACAFAAALFQITRGIAALRLESKLDFGIQSAVWDRLLKLPVPFFRDYTAGDLSSRALGFSEIRRAISGTVLLSVLSGVFSAFNFFLLFFIDANLALLATFLVFVAVVATTVAGIIQTRHQRELTALQGRISGLVLQIVTGISKLRIAGVEGRAFAYWAREFGSQRILAYRARQTANSLAVFNASYTVVASLALFAVVGLTPESARLSTGQFVAFYAAFGQFLYAGLQLSAAAISLLRIVPLYERAAPILRTLPEVTEAKADPGQLSGEIEINHVSFRYTEKGPLVLNNISLHIRRGEFVALVGPSGSGKSTLLRLLLGFDLPASGAIFYDGQNLNSLDLRAVRRQLGVVLQSSQVIAGDLFHNIAGESRLTQEDAWAAARQAGLEDDIRQMPMGMSTYIPAGGTTLSGGQRQRLLIARAIAHRPRLFLFDEATSALDNQTQAIVSRSLEAVDATRIVIAHRLSTIIRADRIIVFDKGNLIQSGTYAELMAQEDGLFATLARRQLE